VARHAAPPRGAVGGSEVEDVSGADWSGHDSGDRYLAQRSPPVFGLGPGPGRAYTPTRPATASAARLICGGA